MKPPPVSRPAGRLKRAYEFRLYETRDSIFERTYTQKMHYILNFNESIRGLTVGAPVEFRGIKIGQVVDIKAEYDPGNALPADYGAG